MSLSSFLEDLAEVSYVDVKYFQTFDPLQVSKQQVFVGCGGQAQKPGSAAANLPFVITNKSIPSDSQLEQSSVTKLIWSAPDDYLQTFFLSRERPINPQEAVSRLTVVADDASPDSVFGFILLLARLAGVDFRSIPSAWVDAVDVWEVTGLTNAPESSWCVLESALAHRHFPIDQSISDRDISRAWLDALRFATHCLQRGVDPVSLPYMPENAEYLYARAALEQERDIYQGWLERATPIQVSLPLSGTNEREMVVDGLYIETHQMTGITKVFFRNDREHSSLKRGFPFAALYSPAKGAGDPDITISIDPSTGLHLRTLWKALERAEDNAWRKSGRTRPTDHPRQMNGVNNVYNQPWYITPNGTLIGRPYRLEGGEPGSLLAWTDVLQVILETLGTLRDVEVLQLSTMTRARLLDCTPEPSHRLHSKCIFVVKWIGDPHRESMVMPPRMSQHFGRILAALLHRGFSDTTIKYDNLPTIGSWDTLQLGGGLVVVANAGIFVMDDASSEPTDFDAIREDFHLASQLDKSLEDFNLNRLRPLALRVRKLLDRKSHSKDIDVLLLEAATWETELAQMRGSFALLPSNADARRIRALMDERWSLDRRLATFECEIHAVESSLRSLNELRTLRIGRFIATYGFAIVLAASVAPFAAKAAFHAIHGGPDVDAPGRVIVFWFVGIAFALLVIIGAWFGVENPLTRQKHRK